MEHASMLQPMRAKCFGNTWLIWMNSILQSGTSSVLLIGVSGKSFHCKRGVRQGDPLSPLLFVLAADFLQTLVNKATTQGLLRLPIPCSFDNFFSIVQYANDTLIIMEGCSEQLRVLKDILNVFTLATGLAVNCSKSQMVLVNVPQDKLNLLATSFDCTIGSLPFTYLGLPLGSTKPRVEDFLPLVSKCERHLPGFIRLPTEGYTQGGRFWVGMRQDQELEGEDNTRFRQVRAAKCVMPYVLYDGLYCLDVDRVILCFEGVPARPYISGGTGLHES
jgi:hypothetical protein